MRHKSPSTWTRGSGITPSSLAANWVTAHHLLGSALRSTQRRYINRYAVRLALKHNKSLWIPNQIGDHILVPHSYPRGLCKHNTIYNLMQENVRPLKWQNVTIYSYNRANWKQAAEDLWMVTPWKLELGWIISEPESCYAVLFLGWKLVWTLNQLRSDWPESTPHNTGQGLRALFRGTTTVLKMYNPEQGCGFQMSGK